MEENFFSDQIMEDRPTKRKRWNPPELKLSMISSCPPSSKTHICIGHAMANVFGEILDDLGEEENEVSQNDDEESLDEESVDDSSIYGITATIKSLFNMKDGEKDNGLTEIPMSSIKDHSTTMYSYRSNVSYIWYVNPWGFTEDYNKFLDIQARCSCFLIDDFLKPSPHLSMEKSMKSPSPLGLVEPDTTFCYYAHMVWYAASEKSRTEAIKWNSLFTSSDILKGHPTTVLFLLTRDRRLIKDIRILHPAESMNLIGPQSTDGLDGILCERLLDEDAVGACVPWTTIYGVITDKLFDQLPVKENNHNLVMRIINTVKDQALCGERNAKYLLGKIMFHERVKPYQAVFLGEIYEEIPDLEGEVLTNIYMREVVRNYDIFQENESLEDFLTSIGAKSVLKNLSEFSEKYEEDGGQPSQLVDLILLLVNCKLTNLDDT